MWNVSKSAKQAVATRRVEELSVPSEYRLFSFFISLHKSNLFSLNHSIIDISQISLTSPKISFTASYHTSVHFQFKESLWTMCNLTRTHLKSAKKLWDQEWLKELKNLHNPSDDQDSNRPNVHPQLTYYKTITALESILFFDWSTIFVEDFLRGMKI